ncbi:hypothetical protein [Nostoc sp.]
MPLREIYVYQGFREMVSVNGILVTRNRKDFEKVPNLRLEDWTIS